MTEREIIQEVVLIQMKEDPVGSGRENQEQSFSACNELGSMGSHIDSPVVFTEQGNNLCVSAGVLVGDSDTLFV